MVIYTLSAYCLKFRPRLHCQGHKLRKKSFMKLATGPNVAKLFSSVLTNLHNKGECLSLASLNSLVYLRVKREYTSMKYLTSAPLQVRLLALPTSIIIVWKGLPGTNNLKYYEIFVNWVCKKLYSIGCNVIKLFMAIIYICQ